MTRRRLPVLALLGINVVVSVTTTLLVLFVWDSGREPESIVLPTFSGVSDQSGVPGGLDSEGVETSAGEGMEEEAAAAEPGAEELPVEEGEAEEAAPAESEDTGQIVHVVQGGDTLFQLSIEYGVSVGDIVAANGFESDEILLDIGQELIIPIGGLPPTATPTLPAATATLALTPIATVTSASPGTVDVSIEQVIAPGDITREAVLIINNGAKLDMENWTLSDEGGNEYVFPQLELFPGGGVTVHTGVGEDDASDLYWGLSVAVWGEPSDTAILRNPSGTVVSEFPIEQ